MSEQDLNALSDEETSASLRVAADLVASSGAEVFGFDTVERLLRAYISIYPSRRNLRDDSSYMASYYLSDALKKLPPEKLAELLDRLTAGLSCTCGHADYDCRCRNGVSKVAGILLDHYFETSTAPHDPDRVWGWMKSLWYETRGDAEKSASIRTLAADNELRHQLHIRAFSSISTHGQAWDMRWNLTDSHHHSGLAFHEGDDQRMADFAFEANNPGVWSAFWSRPAKQGKNLGPDGLRRHLRQQAAANATFAAEWARRLDPRHRAWWCRT